MITATNRDLEKDVEEGRFREDLYYRLNVIPITIPPLRERYEDVAILLAHFVERFKKSRNRSIRGFTDAATASLSRYGWPGNVRELENLVERMAILNPGQEIDVGDLPDKFRGTPPAAEPRQSFEFPDDGIDFNDLVDQYERTLIRLALEKAGGVKNKAAGLLHIKRTTLVEKMKKKAMVD